MTTFQPTQKITKGWNGKYVEQVCEVGSQSWKIHTAKYGSNFISSSADAVEISKSGNGFTVTSYGMMIGRKEQGTSYDLRIPCKRQTDKQLLEAHTQAIENFNTLILEGTIKATAANIEEETEIKTPKRGDLVYFFGYGDKRLVITAVHGAKQNNTRFHCDMINLATGLPDSSDYIGLISKQFGIGYYWEEGKKYEGDLAELEANVADRLAEQRAATDAAEADKKRISDLEDSYLSETKVFEGKQRTRKETAFLKKYLLAVWGVAATVKKDRFSGGDSLDVYYTSPERIEELESFVNSFQQYAGMSMDDCTQWNYGRSNVVNGQRLQRWSYVSVHHEEGEQKQAPTQLPNHACVSGDNVERLLVSRDGIKSMDEVALKPAPKTQAQPAQEATSAAPTPKTPTPAQATTPASTAAAEEAQQTVTVINYSAKALAICGDTYAIKEQLKQLGCKWNKYLKCGKGWVLSKRKETELIDLLNSLTVNIVRQ